jgi:hypothetical protein
MKTATSLAHTKNVPVPLRSISPRASSTIDKVNRFAYPVDILTGNEKERLKKLYPEGSLIGYLPGIDEFCWYENIDAFKADLVKQYGNDGVFAAQIQQEGDGRLSIKAEDGNTYWLTDDRGRWLLATATGGFGGDDISAAAIAKWLQQKLHVPTCGIVAGFGLNAGDLLTELVSVLYFRMHDTCHSARRWVVDGLGDAGARVDQYLGELLEHTVPVLSPEVKTGVSILNDTQLHIVVQLQHSRGCLVGKRIAWQINDTANQERLRRETLFINAGVSPPMPRWSRCQNLIGKRDLLGPLNSTMCALIKETAWVAGADHSINPSRPDSLAHQLGTVLEVAGRDVSAGKNPAPRVGIS